MRRALVLVCLGVLGVAAAIGLRDGGTPPADAGLFAAAGARLLSGAWRHAFGDPAVQAGPVELALTAGARWAGVTQRGFAAELDLVGAAAVLAAARLHLGRRPLAVGIAGGLALLAGVVGDTYRAGHAAELLIALAWLAAAREARAGRVLVAGALVGASAGVETWGLLGVAVLALAPGVRRGVAGAAVAAAAGAAWYLPFVPFGDFRMLDYRWRVTRGVAAALLGHGAAFTWPMRAGEAAIVVCVCGAFARCVRGWRSSVWLVPAAIALAKLVLDPVQYAYYWDTPLALVLVGAASGLSSPRALAESISGRAARARAAGSAPARALRQGF